MTATVTPAVAPASTPRLWPGEPKIVPGSTTETKFQQRMLSSQYDLQLAQMDLDGDGGMLPSIGMAIPPTQEAISRVQSALSYAKREGIPAAGVENAMSALKQLNSTLKFMRANVGDGEWPEAPALREQAAEGLRTAGSSIWQARMDGAIGGTPFPPVPDEARPFFGDVEWTEKVDGHRQNVRVSFGTTDKGAKADPSSPDGFARYWNRVAVERTTDRGFLRKPTKEAITLTSRPGEDVVKAVDELRRAMLESGLREVPATGPVFDFERPKNQPWVQASANFVRMQGEHIVSTPLGQAPAPVQSVLDAARAVAATTLR